MRKDKKEGIFMSKIDNFSYEELLEFAKNSCSMKEFSRKLGYTGGGYNGKTITKKCNELNISLDHFTGLPKGKNQWNENNIFVENCAASQASLRRWYLKGNYTPYKCAICGQEPFWNGKELTLTLDHINGVNTDDRLENLRWICPNCDRQLETFSGKNIKHNNEIEINTCIDCGRQISYEAVRCNICNGLNKRKINRPDIETLKMILCKNKGNFSAVARLYNVTDNAIRKWCKEYNISHYSKDYK